MDKHLFENERVITQSRNGLITLTTHRIRYFDKSFLSTNLVGVMLCNISSISLAIKSKLLYLILAIISFMITSWLVYLESGGIFIIPAAIGSLFVIFYISSRKAAMAIASNGGAIIYFYTTDMRQAEQLHFINQVENAIENHRQLIKSS